ncbi:MAG: 50S ribosomal protein L25 [Acidimicrobiales bacterium]|nr:50S ribosomal protein L25 [Acidimicrobiales bacterium]
MPEVTLHADAGRPIGSRPTRRLRTAGKIPGVVYGHGTDPLPVAVGAREFQVALSGDAGLNTLLSLEVDGKNFLTLARAIQRHPSRNVVTHVDFLIVRRDEVISAEVPINLVGEAVEVAHGDGIVEQQLFALVLKAKPADIPPSLEIDISSLTIGNSLHVTDIVLPSGVELETDPETTVVTGQPPRVQAAEEEAEGAEGAEGEGAEEGAAAAASAGEESGEGSTDSGESSEG